MTQSDIDREWVKRVRAGDDAAFALLLERYQRPVVAFLYRMTGSADEARDLAQDVFVRAYRAMKTLRFRLTRATFSTWLFQIARHAAIDEIRRRNRRPTCSLDGHPELAETLSHTGSQPDQAAEAADVQQHIAQALARLPEDQRTALVLSVYHDRRHAEIAAIMNCSIKSVESRIYRARRQLMVLLRPIMPGG